MKKSKWLLISLFFPAVFFFCDSHDCHAQQVSTSKDSSSSSLDLSINAGGGLIRNTLAPEFDLSAGFDLKHRMQFRVNLSSFYQFEKVNDKWQMYDNYLLGTEFLFNTMFLNLFPEKSSRRTGFGIAYLVGRKGGYFNRTTMKFYLLEDHGVRLRPEVWMTDNFRTFFPGIAVIF